MTDDNMKKMLLAEIVKMEADAEILRERASRLRQRLGEGKPPASPKRGVGEIAVARRRARLIKQRNQQM